MQRKFLTLATTQVVQHEIPEQKGKSSLPIYLWTRKLSLTLLSSHERVPWKISEGYRTLFDGNQRQKPPLMGIHGKAYPVSSRLEMVCLFHREVRHDTFECIRLNDEIES